MATKEQIELIIKATTEQAVAAITKLNTEMDKQEKQGTRLSQGFDKLKSGWMAYTAAIAGASIIVGKAVNDASDLNEQQSKFNFVFSQSPGLIDKANSSIEVLTSSYAMSKKEAYQYMGTLQAILVPMGISAGQAADLSFEMTKLAADLGSFNNLKTADVMRDIQSAIAGQTEPMRKYGVMLDEQSLKQQAANMGLYHGEALLNSTAKAQAALALIMQKTTSAQGDMIRTGDSYANMSKKAEAATEDMSAALGKVLLPVLIPIKMAIANTAKAISELPSSMQSAIVVVGLAGVAIAILTKVVMAFGVAFNAAIWPVTAAVAAIVGLVALIYNWNTVMDYTKLGLLYIGQAISWVIAGAIQPFISGINGTIRILNDLTGSHIKQYDNLLKSSTDYFSKQIEQHKSEMDANKNAKNQIVTDSNNANIQLQQGLVEHGAVVQAEKVKQLTDEQILYQQYLDSMLTYKEQKEAEGMEKEKSAKEKAIKFTLDYYKRKKQLDVDYFKNVAAQRGVDTQNYMNFSNFMMNSLDQGSKKQFAIWKAFAIQQAIVNTYSAAIAGYNAMVGIPIVGPGLAVGAAAAAVAMGMMNVKKIASTEFKGAEKGALIKGSAGNGSLINVGERNKDEMIIPLEDEEATSRLRGAIGGSSINVYIDNFYADDADIPRKVATKIDAALFDLRRRGESRL